MPCLLEQDWGQHAFLFTLGLLSQWLVDYHELIWRIAGGAGEQAIVVLCFLLTYLFTLVVIFLLLWFQSGKSRIWARRTFLTVQGFLLTTSILLMFKHGDLAATPGGMTLAWVIVTFLFVPVLLTAVLWYRRQHDEQDKRKIFWAAFTIQLIAAIGAVYYYAVSPAVRHLGQPVYIREVRLGDRPLGRPLVEGDSAYLKIGDGRLLQVNLLTGRAKTLARISLPVPAEIGYPGYSLSGGTEGKLPEGIVRKTPDELALKFVYFLWRDADQDEVNLSLEVTVNQETGQASWQLTGFTDRPGYRPPEPASYARITIDPIVSGSRDVRISGAGIDTKLTLKGGVSWAHARQGWLLAGTGQGVLYIIDVRFRLAPDESRSISDHLEGPCQDPSQVSLNNSSRRFFNPRLSAG